MEVYGLVVRVLDCQPYDDGFDSWTRQPVMYLSKTSFHVSSVLSAGKNEFSLERGGLCQTFSTFTLHSCSALTTPKGLRDLPIVKVCPNYNQPHLPM